MSTPGLGLSHLSPSQSNKTVTVNAIADGLDGALTQASAIDVSGSADVTPAPSEVLVYMCLQLVGILTDDIDLILPSSGHLYLINNMAPYRPWQANHVQLMDDEIVDPDGYIQKVTDRTGDYKTGATIPTFDDTVSPPGTTEDNHVTWTCQGLAETHSVTVKCGAGSSVLLNSGDVKLVYCDGTNVVTPS